VCKERCVKHTIPATYKTVEEQVMVCPEGREWRRVDNCNPDASQFGCGARVDACYTWVTTPAKYKTVCKKVCDQPERCETETIPAEYKDCHKRVCVCKERTIEIPIPAEYETCTRQVCCKKACTRYETIPAEYKTVEKRVCTKKECQRRIEIPACYEMRDRQVLSCPEHKVWRKSECSAPATPVSCAPAVMENASCETCEAKAHVCECDFMYDGDWRAGETAWIHPPGDTCE
jgi:hypothetical protein